MKTKLAHFALILAISATQAIAAKPQKPGDGGGETGPVPLGNIYFWQSTADPYLYAEMKMAGDGSGKAQTASGEPSYGMHDGQRWFLAFLPTEYSGTEVVRQELFALTENGASLQLTDDPNMVVDNVRWAKNDSFLSFQTFDKSTQKEALVVADVDWNSGIPVIGLPRIVLETGYYAGDPALPAIGVYDWSPAGDELVYNDIRNWDSHEIRVIRFLGDGAIESRQIGNGFNPAWAPVGARIAFTGYEGSIVTVQPDGSDALQITRASFDRTQLDPQWAPDGAHIACTERVRKQKGFQEPTYTNNVLRTSATGGDITDLTADTEANCYVRAWR